MDSSAVEPSDSDSGESWILLETSTEYADEAPELPCNSDTTTAALSVRENIEIGNENDEDSDGISIITDSEPEHVDIAENKSTEVNHPTEQENAPLLGYTFSTNDSNKNHPISDDVDFLGDNIKHKIYVHRRNNKLGSILDVLMLGTIVVTAGIAIGHLWSARNECPTNPSVNKILSNLYKLQEENANLRNKLRDLTLGGNVQLLRQNTATVQPMNRPQGCKKMFEQPLDFNKDKGTKCVVNSDHTTSLMDDKSQELYNPRHHGEMFTISTNPHRDSSIKPNDEINTAWEVPSIEKQEFQQKQIVSDATHKKKSYADSLKNDEHQIKNSQTNINDGMLMNRYIKIHNNKKNDNKPKEPDDKLLHLNSYSEEDIQKDNRYTAPKIRLQRKKHDRHKYKKQKRDNKYEQWEMKGGYLLDYDEFSVTSQDNDVLVKNTDRKFLNPDFENYINQLTETENNASVTKEHPKKFKRSKIGKSSSKDDKTKKGKNNDAEWYDRRSSLRAEARQKLENELFGHNVSNNAAWYFRRMQKREQCRAQKDNSTFRKFSKQKMNFKMKH